MAKKMKKYAVSVNRTGYSNREIQVEAASITEAKKKALDQAGNFEYNEHNADYSVEGVTEITPKDTPLDIVRRAKEKGAWDYEDEKFPREDWRAEVEANDTQLGYFDWVIHNLEG